MDAHAEHEVGVGGDRGDVLGLRLGVERDPACSPCSRAARIVARTSSTASIVERDAVAARAATGSKYFAGLSTIRCTSIAPPRCVDERRDRLAARSAPS